jgi:hypothetical protein
VPDYLSHTAKPKPFLVRLPPELYEKLRIQAFILRVPMTRLLVQAAWNVVRQAEQTVPLDLDRMRELAKPPGPKEKLQLSPMAADREHHRVHHAKRVGNPVPKPRLEKDDRPWVGEAGFCAHFAVQREGSLCTGCGLEVWKQDGHGKWKLI